MDAAERESQLQATQKEIDDLSKQVAEADDEGDERKASGLRDRLHAAKKSFTTLQAMSVDDNGEEEESMDDAQDQAAFEETAEDDAGEGAEEAAAEAEGSEEETEDASEEEGSEGEDASESESENGEEASESEGEEA